MTITRTPFEVKLASPLETSHGEISSRSGWVLRLDDGQQGFGESTPLAGFTEDEEECDAALSAAVDAIENGNWPKALAAVTEAPAARHGLTLASFDSRARRRSIPLYRALGTRDDVRSIPVNATIGDGSPTDTAEAASEATTSGYQTLKVKVGVGPLSRDIERIEAVRTAVGADVELRVDANGGWDRPTAAEAIDRFDAFGVSLVEQPLPSDDLEGHAALRGTIPIALDESLVEYPVSTIIDAGAADILVLKPMALGGVDVARGTAIRAARHGLDVIVSNTIDGAIARTAAAHLAASLPDPMAAGLATGGLLVTDVADDPTRISDGVMHLPQEPGLGITEVTGDA